MDSHSNNGRVRGSIVSMRVHVLPGKDILENITLCQRYGLPSSLLFSQLFWLGYSLSLATVLGCQLSWLDSRLRFALCMGLVLAWLLSSLSLKLRVKLVMALVLKLRKKLGMAIVFA